MPWIGCAARLAAQFLLVLWASSALAQAYPVKDSHRKVSDSANIYWVDERRVLFEGFNERDIVRPDGYKVLLNSLYLWDVKSGALEDQGEIAGGLCYADGYVRYRKWEEGAVGSKHGDLIAGKLGSQVRVDPTPPSVRIDLETCQLRKEPQPLPEWTLGKGVVRLRPEHGFLVVGSDIPNDRMRNTEVTYHPNGAMEGVLMPFKRREAHLTSVKYIPFKGAYFIEGDYFVANPQHPWGGYNKTPWPKDVPIPVWWLYPDGRVEEITLPTESRLGDRTFPAKTGIFYISPDYLHHEDGIFQVDGASVKRVVKGFVERYAVSGDGCRIAMNHDANFRGKRGQGTVKVINVCTQGE